MKADLLTEEGQEDIRMTFIRYGKKITELDFCIL